MQTVARFTIPDGDVVFIFWDGVSRSTYITSTLDTRLMPFESETIRDTIVWAMCGDSDYSDEFDAFNEFDDSNTMDLVIRDLTCQYTDYIEVGQQWLQVCTKEEHDAFQWQSWDTYIAQKIYLTFAVQTKNTSGGDPEVD